VALGWVLLLGFVLLAKTFVLQGTFFQAVPGVAKKPDAIELTHHRLSVRKRDLAF